MAGEKRLSKLIEGMKPKLNDGEYVFSSINDISKINLNDTICKFNEQEGTTIVIEKGKADELNLDYEYVASWITLMVHSSLEAVGLTAIFSTELAKHNISCNVIAGYYHDRIFVDKRDAHKAIEVLSKLSKDEQ